MAESIKSKRETRNECIEILAITVKQGKTLPPPLRGVFAPTRGPTVGGGGEGAIGLLPRLI